MTLRSAALAAALAFAAPLAAAQGTLDVTFRFLPDLTTTPSPSVVQAFLPGAFNDWGQPYVSGVSGARIANDHRSRMTFVPELNEYRYTVALPIGGTAQYKVQAHTNTSGATGFTWLADPLNPVTAPPDGNSVIEVRDPMVFQLAREQEGSGQVRFVSASVFGTQAVTAIAFEVNGVRREDGLQFFDAPTRLFRYALPAPLAPGAQFRIEATDALGRTALATVGVIPPTVTVAPVPAGIEDGITVNPSDPTRAHLVLRAPNKQFVYAIGDFSGWEPREAFLLKRDDTDPRGTRWWTEVTGLVPGQPVRFQYLVDGTLRISDPYAPLVLDQGSDPFIPAVTFPNRPAYPAGLTTQLVSVFTPGATPYVWRTTGYVRPPMEDLVIYEMLVRDWVGRHDFQTVRDSLAYLQRLGITALQLMPVSEFDGNESWGYNPNHYFALDKYYGPPNALKALVDAAHSLGMAVILDVVYNHQTGQAPFVRLDNDGDFGPPTLTNPWVNRTARHPFNVFNDNNHESLLTQYWLDRANRWWLEEYRIDGFRYDLSKGFTQKDTGGNVGAWSAYDQSRIDLLTRMADRLWEVDPSAYVILEHFAEASEERVLANHGRAQGRPGMSLWANLHTPYGEAAMGYLAANSNLRGAYPPNNGYPLTGQVAYMESHDEQWAMYRTRRYGACANAPGGGATCETNPGAYSTRPVASALGRQSLAMAFLLSVPGPKMIWQFGELGYGGGPGECLKNDGSTECAASDPGRVSNKPIRWDYFSDVAPAANGANVSLTRTSPEERALRRALYQDVANVLALRKAYDVFRTPQSVEMNTGQGVADRTITLMKDGLTVVVAGNFGLTERTSTPLAAGQTWHEVVRSGGETGGVVEGGASIALAPGTWRIYANQPLALPTSAEDEASRPSPASFGFASVFPNPVAARATVRFALDAPGEARLDAYDVLGRRVATLHDGPLAAGPHEASLEASALPAGVYVLRLAGSGRTASARVTVAR